MECSIGCRIRANGCVIYANCISERFGKPAQLTASDRLVAASIAYEIDVSHPTLSISYVVRTAWQTEPIQWTFTGSFESGVGVEVTPPVYGEGDELSDARTLTWTCEPAPSGWSSKAAAHGE